MTIVSSAFAKAAPARVVGAGAKTKVLVDKVHALMKRYRIKPAAFYVADNLSRLQFKGTFGRDVKAQDVKRFGGLGGKPVVLDVTVSPGRQVWVEITAWKGKTSISLALPKRDLGTTFAVVQRAVQRLLDGVLTVTGAVQVFVTKQDERDEIARRRYKELGLGGDAYSIRDQVEKAGGLWDARDKVWLLPDEETIKRLAQKNGYMLRHDARRGRWWIDPAVLIEGPANVTKALSGDLKRHFGRWDGKQWRVPERRLNDLRALLDKKGIEYAEREGGGQVGLSGVLTIKQLPQKTRTRAPVDPTADRDFADMLLRRLDESGKPFPGALQKYKGPLDRIKRLKQMKRPELRKLHEQIREAL